MRKSQVLTAEVIEPTPKYARQLEVIGQVNQLIGLGEKLEVVLEAALRHLLDTLGYQAAQIYRLSLSGNELWLYLELGSGSSLATASPDIFSVDEENIVSYAIRTNELVYLPDINKGPYSSPPSAQDTSAAIKSELAVPIQSGQSMLGVLRVQSDQLDNFEKIDIVFLSNLAAMLASVIKNAQIVQQLQDDLQEIKILYNLQAQEDLDTQLQLSRKKTSLGYQYDRKNISEVEDLSPTAELTLTREQVGPSTLKKELTQELVLPIKLYGETIGVIGVEEMGAGKEWLTEDISLLEEISSQVALAIENARL
jgi:GAF domain-containing protein